MTLKKQRLRSWMPRWKKPNESCWITSICWRRTASRPRRIERNGATDQPRSHHEKNFACRVAPHFDRARRLQPRGAGRHGQTSREGDGESEQRPPRRSPARAGSPNSATRSWSSARQYRSPSANAGGAEKRSDRLQDRNGGHGGAKAAIHHQPRQGGARQQTVTRHGKEIRGFTVERFDRREPDGRTAGPPRWRY